MKRWLPVLSLTLTYLLFPKPVFAHAFGKLYNLPVPFWMYLYGGVAAIIVSFLVIGYFFNKRNQTFFYPTTDISQNSIFAVFTKDWFLAAAKITSVFLFFLTVLTGLLGENSAYTNFNMTFFWIIFLLGLTYLTAFIGNLYSVVNPWKVLVEWYEKLAGEKARGLAKYPPNLSYWPALLFYFLLIWFELIGQTTPSRLSIILVQYTLITIAGVSVFGKEVWFKHGEFFSVFFQLIGKLAPIEKKGGKIYFRPPFVGLLKEKAEHFSLLLFILFMLSSTAFDGFRETTPWVRLYWRYLDDAVRPVLGESSYATFSTVGLLLSPFVFLIIYLILVALAKVLAKSKSSFSDLSLQFAYSLVPIAFVYNVAHYFNLLFTEGPNITRLLSDPFGFGWNLFGTAQYFNSIILDANFTWHFQVAIILLGHIVGVYLAHVVALNTFTSHKRALLSQFPMLILMVSYTMIGLWILSQPITSGI